MKFKLVQIKQLKRNKLVTERLNKITNINALSAKNNQLQIHKYNEKLEGDLPQQVSSTNKICIESSIDNVIS